MTWEVTVEANRPEHMCTRMTAVAPAAPGTPTPLFDAFMRRIFAEDDELVRFMQRMFGYCLTGLTREHVLIFGHGCGRNGKSTLLSLVRWILGDYAATAPLDTFMAVRKGARRVGDDLAFLRGVRLVIASEIGDGETWDETRIKALTGGEEITCRQLYGRYFSYTPQFKIFIVGNNKPGLSQVDEAIRSRFILIPFTVTIPEAERDKNLVEKLKAEAPGILRWMIDGAAEYLNRGLMVPEKVKAATRAYLDSADSFAAFLADCTEPGLDYYATKGDAYDRWVKWCERSGERPGSKIDFGNRLEKAGYEGDRLGGSGTHIWNGFRLKQPGTNHQAGE